MTFAIPAGRHMVCPGCRGSGSRLRPRAAVFSVANGGTAIVEEECRQCEGTGWIPPKHVAKQADGDGQEPQE